ncbi:uncharacterized protein LOC105227423 isoform X3 [Bactrocera dorsalis]|uniref:Dipeptidase n=1 Tax=Bactrocera dorsalis TaxID=27457 RepID=A0ABM3JUP0_BACDO|nr:uncharacterized protein LOC105227423 isoform X3 [Bactrocera dorsalis]
MSSGEWNLCALKALEEEEQKEFLALSQKSLFESVCLPTGEDLLHQTGDLSHNSCQPKVSYAQLHPHLLKLPTINECNLIAAARRRRFRLLQQSTSGSSEGERQLQITRVLSLSAHSLTERSNRNQKNVALSETNDKMSRISRSTQFYNVPPFYTPPSMKRCVTSHCKSFKNSLQDLKKQKPDQKRDGTNKSYSKYGSNSTVASVTEERRKLHTPLVEIESYTSDENDSEENSINIDQSDHCIKTYEDCDDSATETGSCSVPLASDSVEAIRLMLSAATAAITYTSKSDNTPVSVSTLTTVKLDGHRTSPQTNHSNNLLTLPSPVLLKSSSAPESTYNGVRNETKEKRERSLIDDSYVNIDASKFNNKKSRHPLVTARYLNSCHKANLLDVSMEFNGCLQDNKADTTVRKCNVKTSPIAQSIELSKPTIKNGIDILSNFSCNKTVWVKSKPIVINKPNNHIQNLLLHATHGENLHRSLIRCKDVVKEESLKIDSNCKNSLSMGVLPIAERPNWTSFAQLHHQFIDDELEEHIKQCSCSCNHMGYGNSMDYQTIGFGGLPDVTEHSNTRRTHSRQNSFSNSDSGGEIANANKSKVNLCDGKSPQTGQTTPVERKSKITHHAAAARCSRAHRLKPRRGSCAIFLTFVGTICLLTIGALLAYQHFMAPSRNSHAQRLKIVRRILKEVPLVDGHNNFAWNVRKYAHNSLELISMRRGPNAEAWTRPTWAQTDVERLKQGLVGVQMCTFNKIVL